VWRQGFLHAGSFTEFTTLLSVGAAEKEDEEGSEFTLADWNAN
jgi:hypothetical protein